jgi:ABC-2 type transport system permease protein
VAIILGFLPSFFLSGFIFEIDSMPLPIRAISHIVPARYFVSSLKAIFLTGDLWPLFLKNALCMAGIGAVLFALTLGKLRKKVSDA